ncbi:MAG TPA: hypothetical protein PLZ96_07205, partial [Bacteroidales bacterium]|nr:hypothetical protein [Bacteroidales bacterium]
NAADLGLDVAFIEQDLFRFNSGDRASVYDVIVSNPPYVTTAEALKMEKRVLEHEPALAMFVPDNDALVFYRELAALAARTLKPGGSLYVEISIYYGREIVQLFEEAGFDEIILRQDISGRDRMIKAAKCHG